jgi:hypothetical protein
MASVISPDQFKVPSTFFTFRDRASFLVFRPSCFTTRGWMKFSVAPVLRSTFLMAHLVPACSKRETWMHFCLATYMESGELHA